MTGRRCLDKNRPHNEQMLTEFAKPYLESKKVRRIIDPRIDGQYTLAVAMKVAIVAKKCLFEESTDRPTADEVVQALEQLLYEGKTRL
ncbi:putative non-specific serine/threonine protein kinase [Helianthus debilis subsp. tardiflorus]